MNEDEKKIEAQSMPSATNLTEEKNAIMGARGGKLEAQAMTEDDNTLREWEQIKVMDTNTDGTPSMTVATLFNPTEEKNAIMSEDEKKIEAQAMTSTSNLTEEKNDIMSEGGAKLEAQAMTLDVAYKSLEMIRQANQELEFKESDDKECVSCKREAQNSERESHGRFKQWRSSRKVAAPCLTCSTPICTSCRSSDFGNQNIVMCLDCAHLFSTEYMINRIVNNDDKELRKKRINAMLEVYDRAMLILKFSMQYIDDVAKALEDNTSRHNKVGLGSSATGVMAGGLGVVAAVTILTPVGPPLLLASILFGGSATAVNASSEAVNYRCEPNKMADRILTLHSVIMCISRLPATMDMQDDHIDVTRESEGNQSSLHWTRTVMNTVKPLTLGALSAVSIVTEGREMKNAVQKIRAGNPCEKAKRLRVIKEEAGSNIPTDILSAQMEVIINRQSQVEMTIDNESLLKMPVI